MKHTQLILRSVYLFLVLLGLTGPVMGNVASAQDAGASDGVIVLTYSGIVTPVLDRYIEQGIQTAQASGAQAVVLQLDTPGGSIDVTNGITQRILGSPVPIVIYVAPAGARAGSAGTFVTLAGHAAAMTPDSSIGAASPVDMTGSEIDPTLAAKIENILSADIENLADRRGDEAVDWAIAAVQDARAATASQALALGVIDFIATDLDDLLMQLDGFEVVVQDEPQILQTADAPIEMVELTPLQQFLNFISDPAVAAILLSLGTLGLAVELRAPGFGFPGIVGIICLLLGFYGLGQLDATFAGMALLAVAIVLFIAEMLTPTFGVLAIGGGIAFIIGSLLLFDAPGVAIPWPTVLAIVVVLAGFTIFAGSKALIAQRRQPVTGGEGMIGQIGTAKNAFGVDEVGSVFVNGEWWNAEVESGQIAAGEEIVVVDRDRYTLIVRRGG